MNTVGVWPSSETEYSPWFVEVAPYTAIALPLKMIEAEAFGLLVTLYAKIVSR